MADPKKIFKAVLSGAFPNILSHVTPPPAGTGQGNTRMTGSYLADAYGDAAATASVVAVGDANPAIPIEILDIYSTANQVTYTPESPPDPPGGGVAVAAIKRYRVSRIFGGIAWNYSDGELYLIEREEKTSKDRPLWIFQPDDTPRVVLSSKELKSIQDPKQQGQLTDFFYSAAHGLTFIAGRWASMLLFSPPRSDLAETATLIIQMWNNDGTVAEEAYLGIFGEDSTPGLAHRRRNYGGTLYHELFWRSRRMGIYSEPWAGSIGDPFEDGRLAAVEDGITLHKVEDDDQNRIDDPQDQLVVSKPGGLVRFYDVSEWLSESAGIWWLKEFHAADAADIVDVALDRQNRRLWVLTKHDIQLYPFQDHYPQGQTGDNDPLAIRAVDPPDQVTIGTDLTLTFQLLDQWGRSTSRTGAVVEFIAGSNQGGFVSGADVVPRVNVASSGGLVSVTYRNTLTSVAESPETIIARLIATTGGIP